MVKGLSASWRVAGAAKSPIHRALIIHQSTKALIAIVLLNPHSNSFLKIRKLKRKKVK